MSRKKNKKKAASGPTRADRADRHALYEQSVQNTEGEFDFVDSTFKTLRGRKAHLLREDFCGTAAMCCEWVRQRKSNHATGVDIDQEVLDWGREHNLGRLDQAQAERITLLKEDVMQAVSTPADILLAMNFSYQLFKTRDSLRAYFSRARDNLVEDGVMFLDAFGGYDAYRDDVREKTKHEGFTYIWEQASYNPVNGDITCHIHFSFPDGSKISPAFTYEWRLWTLPELQELLYEAGFTRVTVYWQGEDEDGEGNDEFTPATEGDADPGWICYISAEK